MAKIKKKLKKKKEKKRVHTYNPKQSRGDI